MNARQTPFHLAQMGKREVRTQFAALPYRLNDGKPQFLLVTSRGTGRWIIPKGWPMEGATPAQAAVTEAYEEAGVRGKVNHTVLGFFSYLKQHEGQRLPVVVAVFPLRVTKLLSDWPEAHERKRKWVGRKKAAKMLGEPELQQIVKTFDARAL